VRRLSSYLDLRVNQQLQQQIKQLRQTLGK
jgi:hypothetical protein